jgi:CBS domain-containing protein
MKIGHFCNTNVTCIERTGTVREAAKIMRARHVGDLVVVGRSGSGSVPCGIITDRDIVVSVVAKAIDPEAVTVEEVMTGELVLGHETDEVSTTAAVMRTKGVRRIPVVNERGELVGIVTADDIIDQLAQSLSAVAAASPKQRHQELESRSDRTSAKSGHHHT